MRAPSGSPLDLHIGRQIRRRRHHIGQTQRELGVACGVTFQQVQKYETAAARMFTEMLWRIARAQGVPWTYYTETFRDPLPTRTPTHTGAPA